MEADQKYYDWGDRCKHTDCLGKYEPQYPSEGGCSCHINPPCGIVRAANWYAMFVEMSLMIHRPINICHGCGKLDFECMCSSSVAQTVVRLPHKEDGDGASPSAGTIEEALIGVFGIKVYESMRFARINIPTIAKQAALDLFMFPSKHDHRLHTTVRNYLIDLYKEDKL